MLLTQYHVIYTYICIIITRIVGSKQGVISSPCEHLCVEHLPTCIVSSKQGVILAFTKGNSHAKRKALHAPIKYCNYRYIRTRNKRNRLFRVRIYSNNKCVYNGNCKYLGIGMIVSNRRISITTKNNDHYR